MYQGGVAARQEAEQRQAAAAAPTAALPSTAPPGGAPTDRAGATAALPSFYSEDTPASANEMWQRLHADPLFAIKQQEVSARRTILTNPVQMQAIKAQVRQLKGVPEETGRRSHKEKKEKKRKKERKEKKDRDNKRRRRSLSSSDDDDGSDRSPVRDGAPHRHRDDRERGKEIQRPEVAGRRDSGDKSMKREKEGGSGLQEPPRRSPPSPRDNEEERGRDRRYRDNEEERRNSKGSPPRRHAHRSKSRSRERSRDRARDRENRDSRARDDRGQERYRGGGNDRREYRNDYYEKREERKVLPGSSRDDLRDKRDHRDDRGRERRGREYDRNEREERGGYRYQRDSREDEERRRSTYRPQKRTRSYSRSPAPTGHAHTHRDSTAGEVSNPRGDLERDNRTKPKEEDTRKEPTTRELGSGVHMDGASAQGAGAQYGITYGRHAPDAVRHQDRSDLAEATRKRLEEAARKKAAEEREAAEARRQRQRRDNHRPGRLTEEERQKRLAEMAAAAEEHDAERHARIKEYEEVEAKEGEQ